MFLKSQRCLFLTLILTLLIPMGCKKKEPPPPAPPEPSVAPEIETPKTTLPLSQLSGLTINGKPVMEIASRDPDPTVLEAADLAKTFDIENETYLEDALQLIQKQLQSGAPLKSISIYLGTLPKKYAAQCRESVAQDLCLVEPVAFNCNDAIDQKNWSDENYAKLCQRLGRLRAYNPNYLTAFFDGDNTTWYQDLSDANVKKAVEEKRVIWEPGRAELLSIYPKPSERARYRAGHTPGEYYEALYDVVGPLWNYNYGALAFKGLPLKETFANFQATAPEPYAPIPFAEMSDLLKYLHEQGIVTGVVSASPIFEVIPMVESLQIGIPLDRIIGLDVFLQNPTQPEAKPVRLSRLIDQGKLSTTTGQVEKFQTYQEVLEQYGDWILVDVAQVINARGGKGVQSRSIARRHVAAHNQQNPNDPIGIDEMRLVLIAGDNFAPVTDLENPQGDREKAALEGGNDQGLSEGLVFLEKGKSIPGGTDLLFINRHVLDEENKISAKSGKLENFQNYLAQQKVLRPNNIGEVFIQAAITDVKAKAGKGGFLKQPPPPPQPETTPTPPETPQAPAAPGQEATPPATPEGTTPSPEGAAPTPEAKAKESPEPTQPTTAPETKPSETPPVAPLPPAPPPKLDQLP